MKQLIPLEQIIKVVNGYIDVNKIFIINKIDFIVGVSRGGLIPAAWLATRVDKPLITVYIDRKDNVYLDRINWIKNKRVLLIDDVIRSGKTSKKIIDLLMKLGIKSIDTFFVYKDKNNELILPWDFYKYEQR